MGIFSCGQSVTEPEDAELEDTEPKMVKVVPKDRWALAERKRREASERALKVANMLADRFSGVVEPVETPLEPGEMPINAGMPRTYRVNTGNTRIYVHTEARGLWDLHCPEEVYNSVSDEEIREMEDKLASVKVLVTFMYRYFKASDESFYWDSEYRASWDDTCQDEDEINKIVNDRVVMW